MKKSGAVTVLMATLLLGGLSSFSADKKVKTPVLEEAADGTRSLVLPDDIQNFLLSEFPNHRFPKDTEFSSEMLQYYFSNLIGVYPAIAWGDFNGDKKKDYLLLIITGDTKWGPQCELVAVNGAKSGGFTAYRLSEIYNFKDDYVSFKDGKLYKGHYKRNGWYINWDPKATTYNVVKS